MKEVYYCEALGKTDIKEPFRIKEKLHLTLRRAQISPEDVP